MKILAIISSFFLVSSFCAQHVNFNSQKNWSLNKKELQFGIGATQFNGDLGGGPTEGIDNSPKDIDWKSTGISGMIGFRYRFHPLFSTTSSLRYSTLKGDDKYSEETVRKERNLHFKSGVVHFQQKLEFIVFSKEQFSPTYNSPGAQSVKNRNQQYYIFGGLGVAYHNPKALYQGDWVALRPLMTEGQDKAYSPFVLTIPMGIGFRMGISKMWRIGMEVSYVKTFTDYMDDVSTVYADPATLSTVAAAVADGSGGNPGYSFGYKRGDSNDKDAFYHLNIVITRNITYKDYGRQRSKSISKSSGKYKV